MKLWEGTNGDMFFGNRPPKRKNIIWYEITYRDLLHKLGWTITELENYGIPRKLYFANGTTWSFHEEEERYIGADEKDTIW